MEEWIGLKWHRFVTRLAEPERPGGIALAEVRRSVELLLHAGGARQRLATAQPVRVGGTRTRWQRIAGAGLRLPLPQLDAQVLALPERLALFDQPELNRDAYAWWAALAGGMDLALPWAEANRRATAHALEAFPGLHPRWQRLHDALAAAEPAGEADPHAHAPVWLWLLPCPAGAAAGPAPEAEGATESTLAAALAQRRRTRPVAHGASRTPLLLAAKAEALLSFADPLRVDRALDDEDDGSAVTAAEEIETLALQQLPGGARARVRFDLDLPAAEADDLPLGPGESLPEWDPKTQRLRPDRVTAQVLVPRLPSGWRPPPALHATAARVRRRLELQRAAPRWQGGRPEGEELDLDAWVRHAGSPGDAAPSVWRQRARSERELATLLLADLSLSTDAHANDSQRVVDVIREALYVFGEALAGSGDAFAMWGFSSVRRTLRLHALKAFDQRWSPPVVDRIGAIRPGYYTRLGAALRAGTRRLAARPERQRLLLLLTDGKPHDLDGYEGRWGLEDTRQAVLEARRAGLLPFAVSLDAEAGTVMPQLFGEGGWAWVPRPEALPMALATLAERLVHA